MTVAGADRPPWHDGRPDDAIRRTAPVRASTVGGREPTDRAQRPVDKIAVAGGAVRPPDHPTHAEEPTA